MKLRPYSLLLAAVGSAMLLLALPCRAQQATAPDSSAREARSQQRVRRWGAGVQLSPLFGLSVRYALTERFTVQVAGLPVAVGNDQAAGARLLFKLYRQPSYNFFVSGGASARWGEEFTNPFTEESGRRNLYFVFSTLGGEYRFAERLGLGGGIGLTYFVERSPILDRNEVLPVLELGLHYYF